MIKNITFAIILLLLSCDSYGKSHKTISLGNFNSESIALIPVDPLTFYSVSTDNLEGTALLQFMSLVRNGSDFRGNTINTVNLIGIGEMGRKNKINVIGGKPSGEGFIALLEGFSCDENKVCNDREMVFIAVTGTGQLDLTVLSDGWKSLSLTGFSCEQDATITSTSYGLAVNYGCGYVGYFDLLLNSINDVPMISIFPEYQTSIIEMGSSVSVTLDRGEGTSAPVSTPTKTSYYAISDTNEVRISVALVDEKTNIVFTTEVEFLWDDRPVCSTSVLSQMVALNCIGTAGTLVRRHWLFNVDGTVVSSNSYPVDDGADDTFSLQSVGVGDRSYISYVSSTFYQVENLSTQGQKFVSHKSKTASNQQDQSVVEPSGFYMLTPFKDDRGVWKASFYDFLGAKQGPYFTSGFGGRLPSNQTANVVVSVQDEDYFQDELSIEFDGDTFFSYHDTQVGLLELTPKHEDVGQYDLTATVTNPVGSIAKVEGVFDVYLSDFNVMFFEPNFFSLLELNQAVPLENIVGEDVELEIYASEDVLFNGNITVFNRTEDEYTLKFLNIPPWLKFKGGMLSGTPVQKDVGLYDTITLLISDKYAPLNDDGVLPAPKRIVMPIRVVEVNDEFEVLSDGTDTISVGQNYSYQVLTLDEETDNANMNITISDAPNWLTYDKAKNIFSGMPGEDDIGLNVVQLLITDEGGSSVLHYFTIEVQASIDEPEGGSISLGLLVIMWVVIKRKMAIRNNCV
jgi:hypothetical protein